MDSEESIGSLLDSSSACSLSTRFSILPLALFGTNNEESDAISEAGAVVHMYIRTLIYESHTPGQSFVA